MQYIFLLKYIYSSSWKLLPVEEELCSDNVVRGVAEACQASQPRTGTDGTGAEGVHRTQTGQGEGKCWCDVC